MTVCLTVTVTCPFTSTRFLRVGAFVFAYHQTKERKQERRKWFWSAFPCFSIFLTSSSVLPSLFLSRCCHFNSTPSSGSRESSVSSTFGLGSVKSNGVGVGSDSAGVRSRSSGGCSRGSSGAVVDPETTAFQGQQRPSQSLFRNPSGCCGARSSAVSGFRL